MAERAKRRIERHRVESQLDATKTLASFEFADLPMLSKAYVMALASGDAWLDKGATILVFGPPGLGKGDIGCGIGQALIDAGHRVLYSRTSELVQRLQAARQSLQLPQALAKLARFDLLILDDLEISRSTLALMIDRDRDLVNRHQPQIYGSQDQVKDGRFVLFDVQDKPHLDARRAQVGLGPIADYKALIEKEYREPAGAD